MSNKINLIIVCFVVLIMTLWWTRYQVVDTAGIDGFYRIDRFTGKAELVLRGISSQKDVLEKLEVFVIKEK